MLSEKKLSAFNRDLYLELSRQRNKLNDQADKLSLYSKPFPEFKRRSKVYPRFYEFAAWIEERTDNNLWGAKK